MAEKYIVYVAEPDVEPSAEALSTLGGHLKLSPDKLEALLRRLPAQVTKPVPETTALTVARHFEEAGLEAAVRPIDESAEAMPAQPQEATGSTDYGADAPAQAAPETSAQPYDAGTRESDAPARSSEAAPTQTASESDPAQYTSRADPARPAYEAEPSRPPERAAFEGAAPEAEPIATNEPTERTAPRERPAAAERSEAERSEVERNEAERSFSGDERDDWGDEFSTSEEEAEENELFPPSSVAPDNRTKGPSAPLLIALIAVLALALVLWLVI